MKIKKIILPVLCGVMCFLGSSALAQTPVIIPDGDVMKIEISGQIESDSVVREISVNVLKPGKTAEDLNNALIAFAGGETVTFSDIVEYTRQIPVNADGSYDIMVPVSANGIYKVYVDYEGNTEFDGTDVRVVKTSDSLLAIDRLIGATSEDNAISILSTDWLLLGFENSLYESLDKTAVAKKFYGIETQQRIEHTDEQKVQKAKDTFDKACIMQGIYEGKASVYDNLVLLGIADGSKLSDYNKRNSTNLKNEIASNMKALTYTNLETYQTALKTATILAVVRYPDGVSDVQGVITEYASLIGISSPSANAAVYSKLTGNKYASLGDLLTAYNRAATTKPSGSTGGSSGGSTGSVVIPSAPTDVVENLAVFSDIGDAEWAREAIVELYKKGIVSGIDKEHFCPQASLTREQFVTMLVNAFDFEEKDVEMDFADVKEKDWYYKYVKAAYTNGIVNGMGDGIFGAGNALTRQDMAVMLMNAVNKKGTLPTEEKVAFNDEDNIALYAKNAVNTLKNAGILNGMGDGSFRPNDINTRAQAAVVIYSVLNLLK